MLRQPDRDDDHHGEGLEPLAHDDHRGYIDDDQSGSSDIPQSIAMNVPVRNTKIRPGRAEALEPPRDGLILREILRPRPPADDPGQAAPEDEIDGGPREEEAGVEIQELVAQMR